MNLFKLFRPRTKTALEVQQVLEKTEDKKSVPNKLSDDEIDKLHKAVINTYNWTKNLVKDHDFTCKKNDRVLRFTNPVIDDKPLFNFSDENNETELSLELYEFYQYEQLLEKLNTVRTSFKNEKIENPYDHGKILMFTIGVTTHDGAPVANSYGFVDTYDIPPIDTWLMLIRKFNSYQEDILFCWIPNEALGVMQDAIDVEILGSYYWLDEENPDILQQLKKKAANMA